MILIERAECPPVLSGGSKATDRYRVKEVVRTLGKMQHGKCCYCEQLIPIEGHGKAVEHFHPQAIFKSRRNDWPNLLLVCPQCNGKKSDKFPVMLTSNVDVVNVIYLEQEGEGQPAVLDPSSTTNPEDHVAYHVEMRDGELFGQIRARNKSLLGKTTIEVTGIDQSCIHKKRRNQARRLTSACLTLGAAVDAGDDDLIREAKLSFQILMASGHEFAGLAREFARQNNLDRDYGLTIPPLGDDASE